MNKTELINQIAEKADLTKKDSEKALNAFIETVTETLKTRDGDDVQLVGFGNFQVKQRAAREGAIHKQARLFKSLLQTYPVLERVKP